MNDEDETLTVDDQDDQEGQTGQADDQQDTFDRAYVEKLRAGSAKYRVRAKKAEQQIKDDEATKLAEDGKWRELAETRQQELDELSGFKDSYEAVLNGVEASNKRRIESVPTGMQSLVPEIDPVPLAAWLDANEALLKKNLAPDLSAGAGSNERPVTGETLGEDELAVARKLGVSEKNYLESKR